EIAVRHSHRPLDRGRRSGRNGARREDCSLHLLRLWQPRRSEHFGDGCGVCLPGLYFMPQLAFAFESKPVEFRFAAVLRKSPLSSQQSFTLKPPKCRIQCALLQQESIIALASNKVGYGVTMKRTPNQCFQNENIQSTAKEFQLCRVHRFSPWIAR